MGIVFALVLAHAVCNAAGAKAQWVPSSLQVRLDGGHDSNLLNASDSDRAAFATSDPRSFFVVHSMSDAFAEATATAQWAFGRRGRSSFEAEYQRRQYARDPIGSHGQFGIQVRIRPASGTRLQLELGFSPQQYLRHRLDPDALPGQPIFRPQVEQRADLGVGVVQSFGGRTSLVLEVAGSRRDDRAPFDARDRTIGSWSVGGIESIGKHRLGISGGFARAISRNTPGVAKDYSYREWQLRPWVESRAVPFLSSVRVATELDWRHYTATDESDASHFGRDDRGGELAIEATRTLAGPWSTAARVVRRWWASDVSGDLSDDDTLLDTEIQAGLVWNWSRAESKR